MYLAIKLNTNICVSDCMWDGFKSRPQAQVNRDYSLNFVIMSSYLNLYWSQE